MVTVTVHPSIGCKYEHREADGFYFREGLLQVTKGGEIIASYPQAGVVRAEKTDTTTIPIPAGPIHLHPC